MVAGKSGVLLIEELKDILRHAAIVRNAALATEFSNIEATYSLEWYKTHVGGIISYGEWLVKILHTLEDKVFLQAEWEALTGIADVVDYDGVVDLIDWHKTMKKNIEAIFMAYKEYISMNRQVEVLVAEVNKHLTLADANLNQMMKRGADLDLNKE